MKTIESLTDAGAVLGELENLLENHGNRKAAEEIGQARRTFYTTSTEALLGFHEALESTRGAWSSVLDTELASDIDHCSKRCLALTGLVQDGPRQGG
jgi:hypothetical protein